MTTKKRLHARKLGTNHHHTQQDEVSNIVVFAAAGGLLGAFAAYLITKQNARPAPRGFAGRYKDFSDKVEEVGENILERGQNAVNLAGDYAEGIRDAADHFLPASSRNRKLLLLGAVSAGILGAASIALWSHKCANENRSCGGSLLNNVKSIDWIEVAKLFKHAVEEKFIPEDEVEEDDLEEAIQGKSTSNKFQDAVNLAVLGIRLWNNLNKRR